MVGGERDVATSLTGNEELFFDRLKGKSDQFVSIDAPGRD